MNTTIKELEVEEKLLCLLYFKCNLLLLIPNILPLFISYRYQRRQIWRSIQRIWMKYCYYWRWNYLTCVICKNTHLHSFKLRYCAHCYPAPSFSYRILKQFQSTIWSRPRLWWKTAGICRERRPQRWILWGSRISMVWSNSVNNILNKYWRRM